MGESFPGLGVRKYATSQGASPSEQGEGERSSGFDHRGNSASSVRVGGQAHSQQKAPGNSTHRPFRAGIAAPPAADSDFDFPGLPREHGIPHQIPGKE